VKDSFVLFSYFLYAKFVDGHELIDYRNDYHNVRKKVYSRLKAQTRSTLLGDARRPVFEFFDVLPVTTGMNQEPSQQWNEQVVFIAFAPLS
jgi:hypothetical protein